MTNSSAPQAFSITGPLPTGTTLIEASAGTGKTWTVAGLVTRYVAELGVPLHQLLVVTFSRAASQELRERVRSRLEQVLLSLEAGAAPEDDELIVHLLQTDATELAQRIARLRTALAEFDTATIATIHQFCHVVLGGLGVAGDSDPSATLAEDLEALRADTIDDCYLAARIAQVPHTPSYAEAKSDARAALDNPRARLWPPDATGRLGARVSFAQRVRGEFERRKRRAGVLSYDDLLSQLADALEDPDGPARRRMREHWSVVLVDEFQDTDPVQWQVFERAFAGVQGKTLVLIGDPKQAIYGFRGGDVETYLAAAATAGTRTSLPVNHRSDGPLVRSLQTLMANVTLSEGIVVRPVRASRLTGRLTGTHDDTPVRLRTLSVGDDGKGPSISQARELIYPDVADDIARLLTSGATFDGRPVEPQNVGVLCYRNADLIEIREALRGRGIPSVLVSSESVLHTSAADWWLRLLMALEQPHRPERMRMAALTPFIGLTTAELDSLTDQGEVSVESVAGKIRTLLVAFHRGGVAAVLDIARSDGLAARLLGVAGGERDLTDLEHVAQLLQEQVLSGAGGISSLIAWLMRQSADDARATAQERITRLDSDSLAVTLSTIHASKGLQYPIVYAPFLFDNWISDKVTAEVLHRGGERLLTFDPQDLKGPERRAQALGEHLRLSYVAMTRAQSQLVLWWAPTYNSRNAGLHRLLFGQANDAQGLAQLLTNRAAHQHDSEPLRLADPLAPLSAQGRQAMLETWVDRGAFSLVEVLPIVDAGPIEVERSQAPLVAQDFDDAQVEWAWRRTSYSSLAAAGERAGEVGDATSEPESDAVGRSDEEHVVLEAEARSLPGGEAPSPMASLPVGAAFGSLVHAVLEHTDFQATDLRTELLARIDAELLWWPVDVEVDELADALVAVCTTPMGDLAGDVRLVDILSGDRLPELDFEVPLAGGDVPHANARLRSLASVLRARLPEGDPIRPYADALDTAELGGQSLLGYLTGSIDLAFRHAGRYYVVDYKTNWLGVLGEDLTLADYAPDRLVAAMNHSSYPLQALLYSAVLHRYLRWRLPDYDPREHFGGVLYLYLRGMAGPQTPAVDGHRAGVFAWQPPAALLEDLSEVLDGHREVTR